MYLEPLIVGQAAPDADLELQAMTGIWTATVDDILAKVQIVQIAVKKLVDNNAK
jgi:hypothetical protein